MKRGLKQQGGQSQDDGIGKETDQEDNQGAQRRSQQQNQGSDQQVDNAYGQRGGGRHDDGRRCTRRLDGDAPDDGRRAHQGQRFHEPD